MNPSVLLGGRKRRLCCSKRSDHNWCANGSTLRHKATEFAAFFKVTHNLKNIYTLSKAFYDCNPLSSRARTVYVELMHEHTANDVRMHHRPCILDEESYVFRQICVKMFWSYTPLITVFCQAAMN